MNTILSLNINQIDTSINHVKALAFSRSPSSTGETKAALYIKSEMNNENIKCNMDYFAFTGAKRIFMRLTYIILFTYLIVFRLLLVIVAYFAVKYVFPRLRNYSLVGREESKNVVAKIKSVKKQKKKPVIILSAHYDTFSANFPYGIQKVFFFFFRIIIIPYVIFAILIANIAFFLNSTEETTQLMVTFTLIEFAMTTIIFLLIYDNNRSKGSIDNASGVAILIELAKLIKRNPLENYDVIILWSSAEEWGLKGSKAYCKSNRAYLRKKYDLNSSFNINVDMVGSYIGLETKSSLHLRRRKAPFDLNKKLEETANELNIPITVYDRVLGSKADHKSFRSLARRTKSSFQVAYFHSANDSKFIHSFKDTPDKCNPENLNGCIEICYTSIRSIDSLYSSSKEVR
ncbi:MAG: M28 family peptidase [Candidatus Lokiarchaeota archaeon]|nr:M28 family peptidase [Candidatus Lokiarchaeota archaeon]